MLLRDGHRRQLERLLQLRFGRQRNVGWGAVWRALSNQFGDSIGATFEKLPGPWEGARPHPPSMVTIPERFRPHLVTSQTSLSRSSDEPFSGREKGKQDEQSPPQDRFEEPPKAPAIVELIPEIRFKFCRLVLFSWFPNQAGPASGSGGGTELHREPNVLLIAWTVRVNIGLNRELIRSSRRHLVEPLNRGRCRRVPVRH
jgi:hypothetical protein